MKLSTMWKGLPLLILLFPSDIKLIMILIAVYGIGCIYVKKKMFLVKSVVPNANYKILGIIGCIFLSYKFYQRWIMSSKIINLAQSLHISAEVFMGVVSIAVGALALYAVEYLLSWVGNVIKKYCIQPSEEYQKKMQKAEIFVLFATAVGIITICSKSSPIYPMNDWVDANAYFTVGRSMKEGLVPYKDLFDHKGPLLYLIHAAASCISPTGFFGMYLVEIVCCFFFLFYTYRLIRLYADSGVLKLMPLAAVLIYTSAAFCSGDSTEELCLPLLAYGIWISIRALRENRVPSCRECISIGITSACVLCIKYTLLGLYIGWILIPIWMVIKQKNWKELWKMFGGILAGILIVVIPFLFYFGIHGAISDLMEVYFYDNLFLYTSSQSAGYTFGITDILLKLVKGIQDIKWYSGASFFLMCLSVIWCSIYEKKEVLLQVIYMIGFAILGVYIGGVRHPYYAFVFAVFIGWGIAAIYNLGIKRIFPWISKVKNGYSVIVVLAGVALAFVLSSNTHMLRYDKSDLPQYQVKDIVYSKRKDPSLLNYGGMDGGFYTASGIQPNCKYFYKPNVPLKEIEEQQNYCINNGLVDYVVSEEILELDLYRKVDAFTYDKKERGITYHITYYLYERKDI